MTPAAVTASLTLKVDVLTLSGGLAGNGGTGDGFVAIASPGGVRVRSSMMQDPLNAVRNLLIVMGNANGDSDIGLMLELNGSNINEAMGGEPMLGKGDGADGSGGGGGHGGD